MPGFAALVFALLFAAIQGCNSLGIRNPFPGDILTGGSEAAASRLLDIPLPPGMERYPAHGYQSYGAYGGREGLESLRGNIDLSRAIQSLHASLADQGWQLRISLRKGDRAVQIYERGNALALLSFRRQTVMTILEIWTGGRLPDGSMPNLADGRDGQPAPEGGNGSLAPVPGTVEQWGETSGGAPGGLRERAL
ncbi:MAG: hypothetical protein LBQ10_03940 [Desulfovibrio sp.]|jgi:hypothetical protein|nr:hypothetical protein [Desulfovibrio sp.]